MSESSSDSGPDDAVKAKKSKKEEKKAESKSRKRGAAAADDADADADDACKWELGNKRFVSVDEFKGRAKIDIREFYDADGELKPGRKGLSLTKEQWQKLKELMPRIDKKLEQI